MRMMLLPFIFASFVAASEPPSSVKMGEIEVRLFYKGSGRFSENILARREPFSFHNTIIGEGDAEEAADDLLISVTFDAGHFGKPEANEKLIEALTEIIATDAAGRVLGRRVFPSILTSFRGTERKVLWLNDVTCAGDVTITARFAGQVRTARLSMGCGE